MNDVKKKLLVQQGAQIILKSFQNYHNQFTEISLRAKDRFINNDWQGAQSDIVERLDLYEACIGVLIQEIATYLGELIQNQELWEAMKSKYESLIRAKSDFELAKTFFNSITRRIFKTIGVNPGLEFGDSDFEAPEEDDFPCPVCTTNVLHGQVKQLISDALANYQKEFRFTDFNDITERITRILSDHFELNGHLNVSPADISPAKTIEGIEMIETVFYRNKAAYIIGRIYIGDSLEPIVLSFLNKAEEGTYLDAVLLSHEELRLLFSYTRSYFRVKIESAYELTRFLKTIMPIKRLSELYTALGYNKHGKAELYREIRRHLKESTDLFESARGKKGMVMIVFTLSSFNVVFKVIKDKFDYPKTTTRQSVMKQYHLVFNHDRAGRLVDAQEFEYLKFPKRRFSEELLKALLASAPGTVRVEGEDLIFRHLYTERRVIPLDIYVKEADSSAAAKAIIEYGDAIKDLAATNIFPGDLFLKNFGVTRLGRVVFYDYDELCFLTECNFRKMPQSRDYDDEMAATPWFLVGKDDVFPEEFKTFIGLSEPLMAVFQERHADLFDTAFWINMQKRLKAGEMIDIYPYPQHRRIVYK